MGTDATVLYLGPEEQLATVISELPPTYTTLFARDAHEVDAVLSGIDVVLDASMAVPFDAGRIAGADRLRLYVTATTGASHVDQEALASRGIPLLTLKGQNELLRDLTPAAEHSWLLLIASARGLPGAIDHVRDGGWDRTQHPGLMLRGRTLGLIGCGRIGQWMARYAHAFGMDVQGFDPYVDPWPDGIRRADLDDLLASSDFVSVHVPLDADTEALLGRREIGLLRRGAIVVNTSRGEIVDEDALADAVEDGRVGGVGIDVLQGEPDVADHRLVRLSRTHPNVVVTPHIGGFSPDAVATVLRFSCRRIVDASGTTTP